MATKYFLILAVAAGFLPVLEVRPTKVSKNLYTKLDTELTAVQEEIVNIHNAIRRRVVPPARNMLKMKWSEEAAGNARIFSKYCDKTDSNPLERRIKNTFCGENTHWESHPISWSHVIKIWYNESKNFVYGEWTPIDEASRTDHYTQVIWASSYVIGCAVSLCRKQGVPQYLYTCHYCHEGNDPNTINVPYKKGSPCEDCPNNCEDRLCTNPCLFYDEYNDCETKVKILGCKHPSVKLFCKATCLCKTEIK
ncbi:cysteine-rich secretory protein 1 [Ictidomys tridecemlineatus]|uniref:cysteine-rich secretory protein 1 n=1 Tax=Ictidomys tridecemlineatus TaxID=43179 RepID=UPI0006805374|nr:cysteine-rich secretory protein 1 [Ictidomys tridecemlineatus]KAG3289610.1 cysteine rich secretory protein 1 [Ictidomys tridecemlineatus]